MSKKEWKLNIDGAEHNVRVENKHFGCKLIINIDGDEFVLKTPLFRSKNRREPFRVGEKACILSVEGGKVDILIDGKSADPV